MEESAIQSQNVRCFKLISLKGCESVDTMMLPKHFDVIKIDPLQREKHAYHEMLICYNKNIEFIETKIKITKIETEICDNELVLGTVFNPLNWNLFVVIKTI